MSKLTITIDTEQVRRFADAGETLIDFVNRVEYESRTGGSYVWTKNAANIGKVEKLVIR